MKNRFFINSNLRNTLNPAGLFEPQDYANVQKFFSQKEIFISTPLEKLPELASELGVKNILVKDESNRFGLNSFKILGVLYAIRRLKKNGRLKKDSILACATEGNHGLAVAFAAKQENLRAKIYVANDLSQTRIEMLQRLGAEVRVVAGNYDEAVKTVFQDAGQNGWLIVSDTSRTGYLELPSWIMAGYTRLLDEAEAQWGEDLPDIVLIQAGVGGLAGAILSWFCFRFGVKRPYIIVCEPDNAACLLESAKVGHPVTLQGNFQTIMAGLRCGEVSPLAWSLIKDTADAFLTITDEQSLAAMRLLENPTGKDSKIETGASGACGLAGILALTENEKLSGLRQDCNLNDKSKVFIINTEGSSKI